MLKPICFLCMLMLIIGLTFDSEANIIWDWEFDGEAGQFLTTGELVGGTVTSGTYDLLDFSVSTTALGSSYVGSISDGHWVYFEAPIPYKLVWDGTNISEWQNNGGSEPYWGFQSHAPPAGPGLKRYYFGVESLYGSLPSFGPDLASLVAAEFAPPTPPGYNVASGTVSVTPTGSAPVPIPTAILLLSSGLIGYVGFRRKFK